MSVLLWSDFGLNALMFLCPLLLPFYCLFVGQFRTFCFDQSQLFYCSILDRPKHNPPSNGLDSSSNLDNVLQLMGFVRWGTYNDIAMEHYDFITACLPILPFFEKNDF